jgi:hypothetical protein
MHIKLVNSHIIDLYRPTSATTNHRSYYEKVFEANNILKMRLEKVDDLLKAYDEKT